MKKINNPMICIDCSCKENEWYWERDKGTRFIMDENEVTHWRPGFNALKAD